MIPSTTRSFLCLEPQATAKRLGDDLGDDGAPLSPGKLEMLLDDRAVAEAEDLDAAEQVVVEHRGKEPTGRKPIPIVPEELEREGLDACVKIGGTSRTSWSASMMVARIIEPTLVREDREDELGVVVARRQPADSSRARGSGSARRQSVKRWQDHMPLNRMEDVLRRESVELPRSTICTWHATLADVASGWWARCVATRSSRLVRRRDRRARKKKCRRSHF